MEISFESYTKEYRDRFFAYYDEFKWLYLELYNDRGDMLEDLCQKMFAAYKDRSASLQMMDRQRAQNPDWYKDQPMLGMEMYTDAFAGDLKGLRAHLDYIQGCHVNFLYLMPLLDSPEGKSDGGYAVKDYRRINPKFGTMEDLEALASDCHDRGISICMDFVMSNTSDEHPWAKKALAGDPAYKNRYFLYEDYRVPGEFERKMSQELPVSAPGNFTWLSDSEQFVMTTFHPYQWDLNYGNPAVLNDMIDNMLYLINQGVDMIRLGSLPCVWKRLGTSCRNLPQVHNIARILRIVCEIVCPGVLLVGGAVKEPDQVQSYFGVEDKPECHMLCDEHTMSTTWHTVATRDVRLLKGQLAKESRAKEDHLFLHYLRCHDEIEWNLDYDFLASQGFAERSHRKYLNDFLTGQFPGSFAKGELYNPDPTSGAARLCGTTASLCGIERAEETGDEGALSMAVRLDLMLHAYLLTLQGVPVLYSGDEIGQTNDNAYHQDPEKEIDARFLNRGDFSWARAKESEEAGTLPNRIHDGLGRLEEIRALTPVFSCEAQMGTLDTWDDAILCLTRTYKKEKLVALFNFSEQDKTAWIDEEDGLYTDLLSGRKMEAKGVDIPGYGVFWLLKDES